jgi:hypothetical protein
LHEIKKWCFLESCKGRTQANQKPKTKNQKEKIKMKTSYKYATDSEIGTVQADSLQTAYASLRAKITDEMIEDGATLWVEDESGDRLTMGETAE